MFVIFYFLEKAFVSLVNRRFIIRRVKFTLYIARAD